MLLWLLACVPVVPDTKSGAGWVSGPASSSEEPTDTDTGVNVEEGDRKPPVAVILVDSPAQVGSRVVFDGSASFDPYGDDLIGYAWNCTDGSTGNEPLLVIRPTVAGNLECSLKVLAPSGKEGSASATVRMVGGMAEWTVMVFINGDNDLEPYAMMDFNELETVGSSETLQLVVQMDRAQGYSHGEGDWTGARRYRVEKDGNPKGMSSPVLEDLGEVDSGDPSTVVDFVEWASQKYPAKKYALVLWDHGDGWAMAPKEPRKGISWDEQSQRQLSVADGDLENLLARSVDFLGQPLDLVGIDACTMATWEVAYAIAPYARVFVGSQDYEAAEGWPYDAAFGDLAADPGMDGAQLGDTIASRFYATGDSTQSVTDLSALSALNHDLDLLALALLADPEAPDAWKGLTRQSLSFDRQNHDLGTLLSLLAGNDDPEIATLAATALQDFHTAILSNYTANKRASGLAIFTGSSRANTAYQAGSWSQATAWDDWVVAASSP